MHFNTKIELIRWREGVARPGLSGTYRQAIFQIGSDGIEPIEIAINVHPAWPSAEQAKVARSFLAARLQEGLGVMDTYSPTELDQLWRRVKPDDTAIESGP